MPWRPDRRLCFLMQSCKISCSRLTHKLHFLGSDAAPHPKPDRHSRQHPTDARPQPRAKFQNETHHKIQEDLT